MSKGDYVMSLPMKCRDCGCGDRWINEEKSGVEYSPNIDVKVKLCECGEWR